MARRISSELFISRLSFYTTVEELKSLFSPFGAVSEVIYPALILNFHSISWMMTVFNAARLIKDPRTQRPKGFAFVKFASEVNAQNAVKAMNGRCR
ncbi:RNA-binding protein 3-like isoform X2 [Olea europaea var. sylvestris]|uniref:RNA-binding protein 3-like isoform X2 n=1 Tax=Olea europaea var. sylvestris TaxID=158386 RepID=UPI000C1D2AEB|nr:RNA-binding protein 3-like isoform X2 [Olea europaea var. sylvestris]